MALLKLISCLLYTSDAADDSLLILPNISESLDALLNLMLSLSSSISVPKY